MDRKSKLFEKRRKEDKMKSLGSKRIGKKGGDKKKKRERERERENQKRERQLRERESYVVKYY